MIRTADASGQQAGQKEWRPTTTPSVDRLLSNELAGATDPVLLEKLWAHVALRLVDWSIRHGTPGEAEFWIAEAERRLEGPA